MSINCGPMAHALNEQGNPFMNHIVRSFKGDPVTVVVTHDGTVASLMFLSALYEWTDKHAEGDVRVVTLRVRPSGRYTEDDAHDKLFAEELLRETWDWAGYQIDAGSTQAECDTFVEKLFEHESTPVVLLESIKCVRNAQNICVIDSVVRAFKETGKPLLVIGTGEGPVYNGPNIVQLEFPMRNSFVFEKKGEAITDSRPFLLEDVINPKVNRNPPLTLVNIAWNDIYLNAHPAFVAPREKLTLKTTHKSPADGKNGKNGKKPHRYRPGTVALREILCDMPHARAYAAIKRSDLHSVMFYKFLCESNSTLNDAQAYAINDLVKFCVQPGVTGPADHMWLAMSLFSTERPMQTTKRTVKGGKGRPDKLWTVAPDEDTSYTQVSLVYNTIDDVRDQVIEIFKTYTTLACSTLFSNIDLALKPPRLVRQ